MKKIIFIFSVVLMFVAFSLPAFSQGICPIETLKVNKVSGKIAYVDSKAPISDIKIELRKNDDGQTFVSKTITGKDGSFEFNEIKKGKYILNVDFVFNGMFWLEYRTALQVKKSNSSNSKPSILISFGVDCFRTKAVTIK